MPDANPEALTIEIYENFSTVSILLLDMAEAWTTSHGTWRWVIYRMSELGLMRVERSLDNEKAIKVR
ncbi:DUF6124 family protein [Pseudomonas arsenicoxydans]|uniref:DUF6124 family protein n=1 Tax=Pseudomonas arsenicoxydans TaxID=702115 RepID=UPI0038B46232